MMIWSNVCERYAKISRIVSANKYVSPENVLCQIIDMCSVIALLERINKMLYHILGIIMSLNISKWKAL